MSTWDNEICKRKIPCPGPLELSEPPVPGQRQIATTTTLKSYITSSSVIIFNTRENEVKKRDNFNLKSPISVFRSRLRFHWAGAHCVCLCVLNQFFMLLVSAQTTNQPIYRFFRYLIWHTSALTSALTSQLRPTACKRKREHYMKLLRE